MVEIKNENHHDLIYYVRLNYTWNNYDKYACVCVCVGVCIYVWVCRVGGMGMKMVCNIDVGGTNIINGTEN